MHIRSFILTLILASLCLGCGQSEPDEAGGISDLLEDEAAETTLTPDYEQTENGWYLVKAEGRFSIAFPSVPQVDTGEVHNGDEPVPTSDYKAAGNDFQCYLTCAMLPPVTRAKVESNTAGYFKSQIAHLVRTRGASVMQFGEADYQGHPAQTITVMIPGGYGKPDTITRVLQVFDGECAYWASSDTPATAPDASHNLAKRFPSGLTLDPAE